MADPTGASGRGSSTPAAAPTAESGAYALVVNDDGSGVVVVQDDSRVSLTWELAEDLAWGLIDLRREQMDANGESGGA